MKVISSPDFKAWTYKFTCDTCKSELRADYNDIKYRVEREWNQDPIGDGGYYGDADHYYLTCPVCLKEKHVHPNAAGVNIPFLLQEKAKKECNESPKNNRHK